MDLAEHFAFDTFSFCISSVFLLVCLVFLVLCVIRSFFLTGDQVKLREKEAEVEEIKRLVSEKQDTISHLEHDLANSRSELFEKERRTNDSLQTEVLATYSDQQLHVVQLYVHDSWCSLNESAYRFNARSCRLLSNRRSKGIRE